MIWESGGDQVVFKRTRCQLIECLPVILIGLVCSQILVMLGQRFDLAQAPPVILNAHVVCPSLKFHLYPEVSFLGCAILPIFW